MNLEEFCKARLREMLDNGLSVFLDEFEAGLSFQQIAEKHKTRLCKYDAKWAETQWRLAKLCEDVINNKPHQFTAVIGINQIVGCIEREIVTLDQLENNYTREIYNEFNGLPKGLIWQLETNGVNTKLKLLEAYEQNKLISMRGIGKKKVSTIAKWIGEPDPFKKKHKKCPHCGVRL